METKKPYIKPKILVEEWKFYKETNNFRWGKRIYEVSNFGRAKLNEELIDFSKQTGYYGICGNYLHRIVAELFIPNPENKPEVDHIDNNKHNNIVTNLKWVTHKENMNNPLTRKLNSERQKIAMNRPEVREKCNKTIKEAMNRPETKQKLREVMKIVWSRLDVKQKQSESQKGNKHTKGRVWINKNNTNKMVKRDKLESFLNEGWKIGMISRKNKV